MSETPINEYSLQMDLTITSLESKDFGGYLCIAKNALGKAEGTIRLQGNIKKLLVCDITFIFKFIVPHLYHITRVYLRIRLIYARKDDFEF